MHSESINNVFTNTLKTFCKRFFAHWVGTLYILQMNGNPKYSHCKVWRPQATTWVTRQTNGKTVLHIVIFAGKQTKGFWDIFKNSTNMELI